MNKINNNMLSLFWTQFFGAFNDNLFKSALIILITYKSISLLGVPPSAMVALCGGLFIFPFFITSSFAGDISDRFDKVWLCHKIKEAEVLIAIIGIIGIIFESYHLMLFVLFLLGLQSAFFGPIKYSLIPEFSEKENLVFSNALINSGTFSAILLGTIVGGVSVNGELGNYPFIIGLLLVSLLGLYFAKKLKYKSKISDKSVYIEKNILKSTANNMRLIYSQKKVAHLVNGLSWFWFLGAGLLSLIPTMAKEIFLVNENVATFMLFVFTLGMGVGPFVLDKVTKGKVKDSIIPLSLLAMTIVIFELAILVKSVTENGFTSANIELMEFLKKPYAWRLVLDLFLISFVGGMFTVPQFTKLQTTAKHEELSRIIAGNNIVNSLTMVAVSLLIMGLSIAGYAIWEMFMILGFLNVLFLIYLGNVYLRGKVSDN